MVWSNNSQDKWTPCGARAGVVRARTGISNVLHILRDPFGARAGPGRAPYDTWRNWHNQNLQKSRTGVVCGLTGPVRAPHGLFTGCLWSLNPYGVRKLIMHALKLYGPRTGRQHSHGAARDAYGPREWTYDFCLKQPGNNPGTTAREHPGWTSSIWRPLSLSASPIHQYPFYQNGLT